MEQKINVNKAEVLAELWRRGNLSWKLHPGQQSLYDLYYASTNKINTWLCGRRLGKSYCLCILAIETCLRNKNSIVKIVSPTKTQIDHIVRPLFKKILEDCPAQIKPRFTAKDYIYYFPNGSEIQLAGTDNGHAEKMRGGDATLAIVDEAGSCQDLSNVVKDILLPTTLLTKGKIILASTPPKTYDHDFIKFIEDAEAKGVLIKKPSQANPLLTEEDFKLLEEELGGKTSDSYRREINCEIIKDPTMSVIPEFDDELEKTVVKEWIKPPFYDCYVGMDLGFNDLTVLVFAYFDFKNDKVIIEDELVLNFQESDVNLPLLVKRVQQKELIHFTDIKTNETKKAFRVSDINPIVIKEIGQLSNYEVNFSPANKQDKEATLNKLRVMLSRGKIVINPRCVTLIRHLKNARWSNSSKTKFSRSADNGHWDALDACVYLIDSINYSKNPYPKFYEFSSEDLFIKNNTPQKHAINNNYLEAYKKIFNIPNLPPNVKKRN